ncbi:hypothetical protein Tco_0973575 [Tanacetum coccineum]
MAGKRHFLMGPTNGGGLCCSAKGFVDPDPIQKKATFYGKLFYGLSRAPRSLDTDPPSPKDADHGCRMLDTKSKSTSGEIQFLGDNLMPPKRMSTFEASAMTRAAIRKLVADSVTAALEAQAANMGNTDNTSRPREAHVARQCSYKEFMSCQPINFKGTEGAIGLTHWFKRTESVFSRSNCTEDCKVKFATGTLTKEALSWWNSFAQPIGIEEAYKIA